MLKMTFIYSITLDLDPKEKGMLAVMPLPVSQTQLEYIKNNSTISINGSPLIRYGDTRSKGIRITAYTSKKNEISDVVDFAIEIAYKLIKVGLKRNKNDVSKAREDLEGSLSDTYLYTYKHMSAKVESYFDSSHIMHIDNMSDKSKFNNIINIGKETLLNK